MRIASQRRQRGFSLLEILITLVVLGGGLLAVGNLYGKVMNGSAAAKERSEAVVQAEKKLDELRYTAYASIASGSDSVNAATGSGSSANYSRRWTITASTSPAYKDVVVTVSWTDSRNQSQSAVLTSRISSIDPARSAAVIATVSSGSGSNTGTGSSGTGSDSGTGTGTNSGTGTGTDTGTGTGTDTGPPVTTCSTSYSVTATSSSSTISGSPVSCGHSSGQSWTCSTTASSGTSVTISDDKGYATASIPAANCASNAVTFQCSTTFSITAQTGASSITASSGTCSNTSGKSWTCTSSAAKDTTITITDSKGSGNSAASWSSAASCGSLSHSF
nr:prepilin-type N-terminal cleavage/methylation domain-containing protein [uncultured Pseudogulbenkiania sp.]